MEYSRIQPEQVVKSRKSTQSHAPPEQLRRVRPKTTSTTDEQESAGTSVPPLEVRRLSWAFGETEVLHNLSFTVRNGEIIGVAGPNGCGKTTLVRLAMGLLPVGRGKVFIDGTDIGRWGKRALAQRVAYIPQFFDRTFAFSAYDSVLMGRHPHIGRFDRESPYDHDVTRRAMEQASAWYLHDKLMPELSGGEAQRVVVARSIAQQPRLLFADEPTAHLDIQYQLQVLSLLRAINRSEGTTVITVLHDLNHVLSLCDRVLLLDCGRIQAFGPPEEVLTTDTIRRVFRIEAEILHSNATGRPHIVARDDVAHA